MRTGGHERLAAERFGFGQRDRDILHLDVKDRVLVRLVAERGDVAGNAAVGIARSRPENAHAG
jgi:hypothetical protein